uniref:Uncharacterized protein n=1 Tax=Anguilla anguilla TaxID=7936 RepID=A0A0E9RKU6_ANGAN
MFLKYPHPVLCYLFFQTVSCPSGKQPLKLQCKCWHQCSGLLVNMCILSF